MTYKSVRFIWLSANLFGYELLKEALSIGINIFGIFTLSPNAKTKMYDAINIKRWYELGLPVYEIEEINEESELLRSLNPDLIIMCGWRQKINKEILNIPPLGVVGFHPTLLPKGRGPAPIINTILEGLRESGVTMYYVSEGLDCGDIIGQVKFEIEENDHASDVYTKVIEGGKVLIKKYLPLLIEGKAPRMPQNEADSTYFKKISLKDNEIKLEDPPELIYRKIKAFSKPYRGAFIKLNGKKLIIWRAELGDLDE